MPTGRSAPEGITAGPDGNLWFTQNYWIGRITTSGVFTEFPIPTRDSGSVGIARRGRRRPLVRRGLREQDRAG